MFVLTKKDDKDYRVVVMKDKQTGELQLIDEGFVTSEKPTATIVTQNSDGTQTITTNKIDYSKKEVKVVVQTLKNNKIPADIESLRYTEGPKSTEYVVVLNDKNGNPTKQVTITENKETKETQIIDYTTLTVEEKYIKPVGPTVTVLPASDYYKPEIKELISKVESKVKNVAITKVHKIEVSETTSAKKYTFVVESNKGKEIKIEAVQMNGQPSVEVTKVQPYIKTTG